MSRILRIKINFDFEEEKRCAHGVVQGLTADGKQSTALIGVRFAHEFFKRQCRYAYRRCRAQRAARSADYKNAAQRTGQSRKLSAVSR